MTTIDRTKKGHRLNIEAKDNGFIVLTCRSERTISAKDKKAVRIEWVLSQLGIPDGTSLSESFRMAENWLAFFEDEELVDQGLESLRTALEGYEVLAQTAPEAGGGQQGALN